LDLYIVLLIGLGLSMDAFAISLAMGMTLKRIHFRHVAVAGLFFGFFQFFMPLIGWLVGRYVAEYVSAIDHWLAAGLLFYLGGKMIHESYQEHEVQDYFTFSKLLMLSLFTSIDALCIGFSFALLGVDILLPAILIGVLTAIVCFIGVYAGQKSKALLGKNAELAGGVVLIIIGIKILLEHLLL